MYPYRYFTGTLKDHFPITSKNLDFMLAGLLNFLTPFFDLYNPPSRTAIEQQPLEIKENQFLSEIKWGYMEILAACKTKGSSLSDRQKTEKTRLTNKSFGIHPCANVFVSHMVWINPPVLACQGNQGCGFRYS